MSIGKLAARFGLATHVLRHWESAGLLTPGRDPGGRRRYADEHLVQVALVLRAKEAGFGLERIREILHAPSGAARRDLVTDHLAELDARIARLQVARHIVEHTASCPSEDFLHCPRLRELLTECVRTGTAADPAR